jgi:starch phosphorylase
MLLLARNTSLELETLIKKILALATDLRWTWSHAGDEFWEYLDAATWKSTRNPYAVLQKLSTSRLTKLSSDNRFNQQIKALTKGRDEYQNRNCWAEQHFTNTKKAKIAYFSMEFALGEALPLYAGGLGVLAGDYLKAASDLGVPAVGVGILYDEGYFRQYVDDKGWQHEIYPHNDSRNLPLQPVFTKQGAWLTIDIELPGRIVYFQVWEAQVGRTTLYLLDSNDPLNSPLDQAITGRLYAGSEELRLVQEIVLGIGGWQIIEALELEVEICHLNEGHAAFAAIERARCFMEEHKLNFWQALWATRAGNIFTTHTPVEAAFDTFPVNLLERYGRVYAESLGIEPEELLNLGKKVPYHETEPFNMAYLAARTCARTNGVSQLHGKVSRAIFADLYPGWPLVQVPVSHITNGVHMPSWDSALADKVWTDTCGKERWLGLETSLSDNIEKLSDKDIWSLRGTQRGNLINYVRRRLTNRQDHWHTSWQIPEHELVRLDPNILTLGFARRFTEYKRPNLLLHDQQRLTNLLTNTETPLQIIIAGKAHPRDDNGKRYIKEWFDFLRRPEIQAHVVFLEDYDLRLAQHLVQGVDVWLNTPRRPWEACGTSGMKVLVNGGLNISELDGWWAEAYTTDVGWSLGDTEYQSHEDDQKEVDSRDAQQLYDLLEQQVIPCFYQRDSSGIPINWVQMIRRSMSQLTPKFSSNRMLRDYTEKLYLPALENFKARCDNGAALAIKLFTWESCLHTHKDKIHWGDLRIYLDNNVSNFAVSVYFGDIPASYLKVQLFADSLSETEPPVCMDMQRGATIPGSLNGFVFHLVLETQRPIEHFTPRVTGVHDTARIPAEIPLINWWSGTRIIIDDDNQPK